MDDLTDEALFQRGLFELATGLRNQHNGIADPWPPDEVDAVLRYLVRRVAGWRQPSTATDEAARAYVAGCVTEAMACAMGSTVQDVDHHLVDAIACAHAGRFDDAARAVRDALRSLGLDGHVRVKLWVSSCPA